MNEKIVNEIRGIAFFDTKEYDRKFFGAANAQNNYNIHYYADKCSTDLAGMIGDCNVVCAFVNDDLSAPVLEMLLDSGVQLLAMRCAGFNNVDLKFADGRLPVVRVPAYSPYAVAEYATAMLLTMNRKTHRAYFRTRDNNYSINGLLGFDIHGKTVGVIGTGKIGQLFCRIMLGFGARVIAYDLYPDAGLKAAGVEYVPLEELYRDSHIISLHCPLTEQSFHLIDDKALSLMRRGVMIINTSRGRLIDTRALIKGLKKGIIGAAGLDVYEEEGDYFFEDFSDSFIKDDLLARLATFNNVLLTSHQGFFTDEAMTNIATTTLANIREFELGKTLTNEVCFRKLK